MQSVQVSYIENETIFFSLQKFFNMKNFKIFGVKFPILLILVLLGGCGPKPTTTQPKDPVDTVKKYVALNVSDAPAFPLWNGNNYCSIVYNASYADSVKCNGVLVNKDGGTIPFSNLTQNKQIIIIAYGNTGSVELSRTIRVFTLGNTNLSNTGIWKMALNEGYSGGVWTTYSNLCRPTKFYPTGDSIRIYNSICSALPDVPGVGYLTNNDSQIFWGQTAGSTPQTVLKLTADSVVTLTSDGLTRRTWVH